MRKAATYAMRSALVLAGAMAAMAAQAQVRARRSKWNRRYNRDKHSARGGPTTPAADPTTRT